MEQTKLDKALSSMTEVLSSRRVRSTIFLILSFVIILAVNALLPVIEGQSHFTAEPVEYTYTEYLNLKKENPRYNLTWASELRINEYKRLYRNEHPDLTADEIVLLQPPPNLIVEVYTKHFFQYVFWYVSTAISIGSAILLFYSAFNFIIIRMKENEPKYLTLTKEVEDMADNCLDPITFEPWMADQFNIRRKVLQHTSNVKYELQRLQEKTDHRIKNKFIKIWDLPIEERYAFADNTKLKWKERRYFNKREALLSLLQPSYIEEYVKNGKIKYFRYIHPLFVTGGTNEVSRSVDSYSMIRTDVERIQSESVRRILLMISITILFAVLFTITVVTSVEKQPFWVVLNIISKLAPLILQIPFAMDYSNTFMKGQLIGNLLQRRSIGLLYLAERGKEGCLNESQLT
jgi:hypothetical protein